MGEFSACNHETIRSQRVRRAALLSRFERQPGAARNLHTSNDDFDLLPVVETFRTLTITYQSV